MPRKGRTRRMPTTFVTAQQREYLSGLGFCHLIHSATAFFHDEEALKAAWGAHRDDILDQWAREKPGFRPPCWWAYDNTHGPTEMIAPATSPFTVPKFESELEFLGRNGLLRRGERMAAQRMEWQKEQDRRARCPQTEPRTTSTSIGEERTTAAVLPLKST